MYLSGVPRSFEFGGRNGTCNLRKRARKKEWHGPLSYTYPAFFICFALILFVFLFFQVSRDSFAFEQLINWSCLGTSIPEFVKERDKVSSKQLTDLPRAR